MNLSDLKEYRNLWREIKNINEDELSSVQRSWLTRAKEILNQT